MKDQRGVVYLETLVAFLPVFLFFLATLQIADLSAAHIIVRHAATVAARAAVVVMPDDGRYYNDEDNEKLHAFDGLRRQDIEHAADLILRANPRLDNAPSNVVVGFQSPPTPPPPSPNRFACPPDAPQPCMSREEVLAAAFNSQTAGELLDTSTKGEGDWGMREKLDALVTAKYRCMIRFFCPRDFTMVATASLLYQGARYTYEAWPDSIRSDGRPGATPAAPVGPPSQIPGGSPNNGNAPAGRGPSDPNPSAPPGNAPTDPGTLPDDAVAGQAPAQPGSNGSTTNPGVSEPVANAPPGSTHPGGQVGSGSTPTSPPTAAAPGSSSPPSGSTPSNPVANNPSSTTPSNPVANNPSPTRPSAPVAISPSPATPSTPGASSSPATSSNGQVASNTPSTGSSSSTRPGGSNGTGPGASNSNANNSNGAVASNTPPLDTSGSTSPGAPTTSANNGAVASNGSSHTSNSTGSRTRPSIVAREPTDSDAPTVTPTNRRNPTSNATQGDANSSNSDRANQTGTHAAATPANNGGSTRGNTQTGTNTASNNGASATNPTRGPAPTRGPPGTNANSGRDTQGVISSAVASDEDSSSTIPGNDRSNANTPASSASIIANGPDANGNAANGSSRAPRNVAELRAQLPSDIRNVPIVSDPSLQGNTVRAHYTYDARGRVTGVEIRVGPNAQPRHIADHVNTVRTLQGYQGLSGRVRLVLDKLNAWIAGHPNVRPGSLAWETRREVEKLQAIVDARTQALNGANLTQAQRTELENERREYARQLAQHEANLATITNEPGRGYVAADNTSAGSEQARIAGYPALPNSNIEGTDGTRMSGYAWRYRNGQLEIVNTNATGPKMKYDPNTGLFYPDDGRTAPQPVFPANTSRADAYAALGGHDPSTPFGQYTDMLIREGLASSHEQLIDLLQDPSGNTHRTVRSNFKGLWKARIIEHMRDPHRLAATPLYAQQVRDGLSHQDALRAASHAEMVRITRSLYVSDRGALAESWYASEHGDGTTVTPEQVTVTPADAAAAGATIPRTVRIDRVDGPMLQELKNVQTALDEGDREAIDAQLSLVGHDIRLPDGRTQHVEGVQVVLLDPQGVLANAQWGYDRLAEGRPNAESLAIEIHSATGTVLTVTQENRAILNNRAALTRFLTTGFVPNEL
jgi:hypothetical protein